MQIRIEQRHHQEIRTWEGCPSSQDRAITCNTVAKDAVKSKRCHNGKVVEESSEVLLTSMCRVVLWMKFLEVFHFSKTGQTIERYFSSLSYSSTNMGNTEVHGVGVLAWFVTHYGKFIESDWRMISNPLASLCQLTHFVVRPHSMPTLQNMSSPPSLLDTCGLWKYNVTHYLIRISRFQIAYEAVVFNRWSLI